MKKLMQKCAANRSLSRAAFKHLLLWRWRHYAETHKSPCRQQNAFKLNTMGKVWDHCAIIVIVDKQDTQEPHKSIIQMIII